MLFLSMVSWRLHKQSDVGIYSSYFTYLKYIIGITQVIRLQFLGNTSQYTVSVHLAMHLSAFHVNPWTYLAFDMYIGQQLHFDPSVKFASYFFFLGHAVTLVEHALNWYFLELYFGKNWMPSHFLLLNCNASTLYS